MAKKAATALVDPSEINPKQMKAQQAREHLTAAEQPIFNRMLRVVQKAAQGEIISRWEIGAAAAEAYRQAEKLGLSGNTRLQLFTQALGLKTDRFLKDAIKWVDRWPSLEDLQPFVDLRGEAGNVLSVSHINALVGIADQSEAMQQAERALQEELSAKALTGRVKLIGVERSASQGPAVGVKAPPVRRPGTNPGGQPIHIPTTPNTCLATINEKISSLPRLFSQAWFSTAEDGTGFNLIYAVGQLKESEKHGLEFQQRLESCWTNIQRLRQAVNDAYERMRPMVADLLPNTIRTIDVVAVDPADATNSDTEEVELAESADEPTISLAEHYRARTRQAAREQARRRKNAKKTGKTGKTR